MGEKDYPTLSHMKNAHPSRMNSRAHWHRTSITIKMKLKSSKIETQHNRNADNTEWLIVFIRARFRLHRNQITLRFNLHSLQCTCTLFAFSFSCHFPTWIHDLFPLIFYYLCAQWTLQRFAPLCNYEYIYIYFLRNFRSANILSLSSWWFLNLNTF